MVCLATKNDESQTPIRKWSPKQHAMACSTLVFLSVLIGSAMARWTDAASPFVDAATTVSALLATWMVARKLLENWLYWIAIDIASIGLYLSRDLSLTALFAGYVLLAAWGYRTWRAQWHCRRPEALPRPLAGLATGKTTQMALRNWGLRWRKGAATAFMTS